MAKDMKTFQTINLSDYYSNNGSQYSTMGDITHYSEGGKRFDNTSPIDQKLSDQTPIDDFIKALKNPKALAEVQEKSGIEVFPSPSTPTKIGISTTGFNFAPAFTVPNTTGFTFIPSFLTPTVANNMTSPINAGLSVSNNMTSPINAGLSVYNTMAAPNHGYGILGIHDGIPNVNATGFTPNTTHNGPSEFVGVSGVPGAMDYTHTGNSHGIPGIHNGIPNINATGFTPNTTPLGPSEFVGVSGVPGAMNYNHTGNSYGIPGIHDQIPNINATGFTTNTTHNGPSEFTGVSGVPGAMNYIHTGNQGLGTLGIWDSIPNINAVGFIPYKAHLDQSDFVGISGGPNPGTFSYNHTGNQGLGLIGTWDGIPNIDANGFIPNKHHLSPSDFRGISGEGNNLTYDFIREGNGGGQIWGWTRSVYNNKIGIGVNNFTDIDASGFIRQKSHLSTSDFTGITGATPNMKFDFNPILPPNTSYAFNRLIYNDKISVPVDGFGNQKATGFTLGKLHMSPSNFEGIKEIPASGQFTYKYPTDISPFQSYAFTDSTYPSIMDNVQSPTAPNASDGVGQSFSVRGKLIDGKKARLSNYGIQIQNLYTSIPGKGETDLRRESHNSGFYGQQPFIMRDIGSNWSLFSDGPGPVHGDSLIRGGAGTSLNRALHDIGRIGKYMITPSGLLFIAKNIGMQLSNPKWQGATLFGTVSRTRVYPLGLSTLAQVAVNGLGIHLVRHGFGPLEGDGTHYEKRVNEIGRDNYTKGKVYGPLRKKNRLYALGNEIGVGYWDEDVYTAKPPKHQGKGIFAKLARFTVKQLKKLLPERKKIRVLSGVLGPHSLYGIGRTRIYRSKVGYGIGLHTNLTGTHGESKRLTTSWGNTEDRGSKLDGADFPTAENPNFINNKWTPKEDHRYGDNIGEEGKFKSHVETQIGLMHAAEGDNNKTRGSESPSLRNYSGTEPSHGPINEYEQIQYGTIGKIQNARRSINDFRQHKTGQTSRAGKAAGTKNSSGFSYQKGDDRVRLFNENYGKVGITRNNRKADLGLNDKSVGRNDVDMPEPVNALNEVVIDGKPKAANFPDLVLFEFTTFQTKRNKIQFRAFLTELSDTLSPSFSDVGYIGRTSPTYLFKSISRECSFGFKIAAMTRQELDANYKRLNRLMQSISPGYTSGNLPIGPMIKLTIGNYFQETPVVIDSFEITVPESSPWDIDTGRQLPLYLDVSMGAKIMFNEAENYNPQTGKFKKADEDGFPTSITDTILKSTSNYFNAINMNFGRGEKETTE